jgi:hypothetical protein
MSGTGGVEINPQLLKTLEFSRIWNSDKTKDKSKALKIFTYIYYLCDHNSIYSNLEEESRKSEIIRDCNFDFEESEDIKEAINKYKFLSTTANMRLFNELEASKDNFTKFIADKRAGNFTEEDIDVVLKIGDKLEKLISSSNRLRELIVKERTNMSEMRGGGEKRLFEDE